MLRIVGGILIIGGTSGLGILYRKRLCKRIANLRILIHILEMFKSEINYGNTSLPECCRFVSERLTDRTEETKIIRGALQSIFKIAEKNKCESFAELFREEMRKNLGSINLEKDDIEIFTSFVEIEGVYDLCMQTKLIEFSIHRLEENYHELKEHRRERIRAAMGLGFLSGIFLVILLL